MAHDDMNGGMNFMDGYTSQSFASVPTTNSQQIVSVSNENTDNRIQQQFIPQQQQLPTHHQLQPHQQQQQHHLQQISAQQHLQQVQLQSQQPIAPLRQHMQQQIDPTKYNTAGYNLEPKLPQHDTTGKVCDI